VGKAYLLTGEPRIGKTTALKKVIDGIGVKRCGGFYTEEVCVQGERCGFRLVTLDGQIGTMADVNSDSPLRVGRYGVVLDSLEDIGLAAVYKTLSSKSLIVIDEIGPMQLFSDKFKLAILDVLKSTCPLLGTVFCRPDPWLDELKRQNDVELYQLTLDNRNEAPKTLIETLQAL
jgi:nucleoside-triphosphatase